jgi:hypothetical protein
VYQCCKIPCLDFGARHEWYKETLNKPPQSIRTVRPNRNMNDVLLLHDNALPHTGLRTREAIVKKGTGCSSPSCSQPTCDTLRLSPVWVCNGCHFAHYELKRSHRDMVQSRFTTLTYNVLFNVGKIVLKMMESLRKNRLINAEV